MWPKALLELLPHLTRLVPLANRYFQSRSESENDLRSALERRLDANSAALRVDIEKTAEANERLLQQLSKQTATLAQIAEDTRAIKASIDSQDARLRKLEENGTRHFYLIAMLLMQFITICILAAMFLFVRK